MIDCYIVKFKEIESLWRVAEEAGAAHGKWSMRIFWFWSGGDATENGDFQTRKQRLEGYKKFWMAKFSWISSGDDATENGDFQTRKQRLQGYKKFWMAKFSWISSGDDATENGDFQRGKQRLQGYKKFSDLILSTQRMCTSWSSARTARHHFCAAWSTSSSCFLQYSRHCFHFAGVRGRPRLQKYTKWWRDF